MQDVCTRSAFGDVLKLNEAAQKYKTLKQPLIGDDFDQEGRDNPASSAKCDRIVILKVV